jgi:hypothetical protein
MYQRHSFKKEGSEESFEKLITIFKESIKFDKFDKNDTEFDLHIEYAPNHACIWNKIHNIGKPCKIIEKNSELAFVVFEDNCQLTLDKFYRLEDLSIM